MHRKCNRVISTSSLSNNLFMGTFVSVILGIPIMIGMSILALSYIIVSCVIGIPVETLIQILLVFGIVVFGYGY